MLQVHASEEPESEQEHSLLIPHCNACGIT